MTAGKPYDDPERVAARDRRDREERCWRTLVAFEAMRPAERHAFLAHALALNTGPSAWAFETIETEAERWAALASLAELVAFGAAIACALAKKTPAEFARQMLRWGWKMARPQDRKAFLMRIRKASS